MADRRKAVGTPRFWRIDVGWACGGTGGSVLGLLGRRWFGFGDGVCRWRGTVEGWGRVGDTRAAGAMPALGGPAPACIRWCGLWPLARQSEEGDFP